MSSYGKPMTICDGKNFFVDPDWWENLSPEERENVRRHEKLHIAAAEVSKFNDAVRMFTESDFSDGSGPWTCGFTREEAHDLLDDFWDDCQSVPDGAVHHDSQWGELVVRPLAERKLIFAPCWIHTHTEGGNA